VSRSYQKLRLENEKLEQMAERMRLEAIVMATALAYGHTTIRARRIAARVLGIENRNPKQLGMKLP
jgi:hypothetical protein